MMSLHDLRFADVVPTLKRRPALGAPVVLLVLIRPRCCVSVYLRTGSSAPLPQKQPADIAAYEQVHLPDSSRASGEL